MYCLQLLSTRLHPGLPGLGSPLLWRLVLCRTDRRCFLLPALPGATGNKEVLLQLE